MKRFKLILLVILQSILVVAVLLVGWSMATTDIDLTKAKKTTGVIVYADMRQTTGAKAVPGQKDFIAQVKGVDTSFWIYRMGNKYADLQAKLKPGSTVTIYHSDQSASNNYYTVYQLEKGNETIYSKDEYQGKEKLAGRFVALPGGLFMLVAIIYSTRKQLRKLSASRNQS